MMATRLALAFGLTCVRLYLNGVDHSLKLSDHSLVQTDRSTGCFLMASATFPSRQIEQ